MITYSDIEIVAIDAKLKTTKNNENKIEYKVYVSKAPNRAMAPADAVKVSFILDELQDSLGALENRELDKEGMIGLGRILAAYLFPWREDVKRATPRDILAENLNTLTGDSGIRLRLNLPPLLSWLPWEYVYVDRAGGDKKNKEEIDGFLVRDPRVAIVRHQPEVIASTDAPNDGDIRVLAAIANPPSGPRLNLKKEKKYIDEAFKDKVGFNVTFIEKATLEQIEEKLRESGIFHFSGHGGFKQEQSDVFGMYSGTGALLLQDQSLPAEQLAINVQGSELRLVVLGGCETGRRDGIYVWGGIAPALMKAGVPAVVANQYKIDNDAASAFSRRFYQALVGGLPIEEAVALGRLGIFNEDPNNRDWGVPVLYLNPAASVLFKGATDEKVRESAVESAQADVDVQVGVVEKGGFVLGADVDKILSGKLAVQVTIDGTAYGTVVGLRAKQIGGSATVKQKVKRVGKGGKVIGAKIKQIGG